MRFFIVHRVREHDVSLAVERDAVVRVGQVLRGEPEVQRVLRHDLERKARRNGRCARSQRVPIQLSDKGDVAHWVVPFL